MAKRQTAAGCAAATALLVALSAVFGNDYGAHVTCVSVQFGSVLAAGDDVGMMLSSMWPAAAAWTAVVASGLHNLAEPNIPVTLPTQRQLHRRMRSFCIFCTAGPAFPCSFSAFASLAGAAVSRQRPVSRRVCSVSSTRARAQRKEPVQGTPLAPPHRHAENGRGAGSVQRHRMQSASW